MGNQKRPDETGNLSNPAVSSGSGSLSLFSEMAAREGFPFWEMLAGVFDGLKQGLIVADRAGRVIVFNRAAEQIMGYQREQVVGHHSLWDFCEECDRPPLFREGLAQGHSFPEEEVAMRGPYGTVGVRVTALYDGANQLQGALAVLRSLDQIRAREQQQKHLVRLAAIGRIFSAVAHEINNPLQTVRTLLELAADQRKTDERRREYLRRADHEISRIALVIEQMRSFYRPSPGSKLPTQLNAKLTEAVRLLEKPLHEAGVSVGLELDEHLPPLDLFDYQLEQVILNLILHSIEAMPHGGRLHIATHKLEDHRVAISFQNGLFHHHLHQVERLFDPLEQRHNSGRGIGLSVSREIISELGGTIEFSSAPYPALTVYLPC